LPTKKKSTATQLIISIVLVVALSALGYVFRKYVDYMAVALILLLAVSTLAILFDIFSVLIAAILSALILNFFFIEPYLNYKINDTESALLFFIYIFIALVNAVLTNRLRKQESKIRDREEKENTIKIYNTLLNSLSHELKTPIATIIGTIDTLKESDTILLPDQRMELLSEIGIASNRLNTQVENLLNMSRLEAGNFQLKTDWTDINELIFIVIRKLPENNTHTVVFDPDEKLPLFKVDRGLVETVLYNLINNAVRYTPVKSTVTIFTGYTDGHLNIKVSDNGKGIPPSEADRIFNKFYRLPNSGTGGSGLGLSIAKGFIEAHHGNISVDNNKSGGAVFTISIPCEISYLKNLKNE
jgi:two-component system sensor histidine kinase KdpD